MATLTISLPEPLRSYVENQVHKAGYGTVSEYLRELIRADQIRRNKLRKEPFRWGSLRRRHPQLLGA